MTISNDFGRSETDNKRTSTSREVLEAQAAAHWHRVISHARDQRLAAQAAGEEVPCPLCGQMTDDPKFCGFCGDIEEATQAHLAMHEAKMGEQDNKKSSFSMFGGGSRGSSPDGSPGGGGGGSAAGGGGSGGTGGGSGGGTGGGGGKAKAAEPTRAGDAGEGDGNEAGGDDPDPEPRRSRNQRRRESQSAHGASSAGVDTVVAKTTEELIRAGALSGARAESRQRGRTTGPSSSTLRSCRRPA